MSRIIYTSAHRAGKPHRNLHPKNRLAPVGTLTTCSICRFNVTSFMLKHNVDQFGILCCNDCLKTQVKL